MKTVCINLFKKLKFEILIAVIILIFIGITVLTSYKIAYDVDKAGGVKQIIINLGKEVKDISQEIDEYRPDGK